MKSRADFHPPSTPAFTARGGFTLLEVLLALGLTAIAVALVGTAVSTTLNSIDTGRRVAEREQLARAVLHRIADDLRAVVRYEPFDESGLNSAGSATSAAGLGSAAAQLSAGSTSSSGASTGSGETDESSEETDPALASPTPGIYGTMYDVRIDISRIPRLDEYLYAVDAETAQPRGDLRTVSYFLSGSIEGLAAVMSGSTGVSGADEVNQAGGLARSEIDRAAALWQTTPSTGSFGMNPGEQVVVLAPEVAALEFRYFDGAQWLTEWDTSVYGGLPRAVEVTIYLHDVNHNPNEPGSTQFTASGLAPVMDNPNNLYRMVVHLPAGIPLPATPTAIPEESTESSESNSNATSGGQL